MRLPQLLLFAIDGADFHQVRQMVRDDRLPNLARIAAGGAWGPLRSTIPPVTNMAWPSIFTGMNPGRHGLFNFFDFPAGNRVPQPVYMDQCKAPTLWRMLNEAGYRLGVWRLPWGYPAEKIDGYMLCDKSPEAPAGITWPDALLGEIRQHVPDFAAWSGGSLRSHTSPERLSAALSEELQREARLLHFCMSTWPADIVLCGMSLLDLMGHQLLGCGADAVSAMDLAYERIDRWVGEVVERWTGPDTLVGVVSDHGLGPMSVTANVLRWLVDNRLLAFEHVPFGGLLPAARVAAQGYLWIRELRSVSVAAAGSAVGFSVEAWGRFASRVNWRDSVVVPWGMPGAMWLNLDGDVDRSQVLSMLRSGLFRLRHPRSGTQLVTDVMSKEDLYWGAFTDGAPDLVVVPGEEVALATGTGVVPGGHQNVEQPAEVLWNTKPLLAPMVYEGRGWFHRPLGIIMLSGPGVASGSVLRGATVLDVTPTLLYALGLSVPAGMDGQPRTEAFEAARLISTPISFRSPAPPSEFTTTGETSDAAHRSIAERLQGMGYL